MVWSYDNVPKTIAMVKVKNIGKFAKGEKMANPQHHPLTGKFAPRLVPASDEKGFGVTVQARCPPGMARRISELLAESLNLGTFGWKTNGDVVRWLLATGLEFVDRERDSNHTYKPIHQLDSILTTAENAKRDMDTIHTRLSAQVSALESAPEGRDDAEELLQEGLEKIFEMPETPWRTLLIDRLQDRFPHLLKRPKRAIARLLPVRSRGSVLPYELAQQPEHYDPLDVESSVVHKRKKRKEKR
jgi:hypothetical protein